MNEHFCFESHNLKNHSRARVKSDICMKMEFVLLLVVAGEGRGRAERPAEDDQGNSEEKVEG